MEMLSATNRNIQNSRIVVIVAYLFLLFSPVIAGEIRGVISNTNISDYDAYSTSSNDEIGYYRSIVCMRKQGLPKGVNGYNEYRSRYPAYGYYNYVTYFPYLLMSFITGIETHNFIVYSNVIMMMTAYLVLVLLLKPKAISCFIMGIFQCGNLMLSRYIWSGMSEANTISGTIVIFAIWIYLYKSRSVKNISKKELFLLITQINLIWFYGLIRPFNWFYLIIPMMFIWDYVKKKKLKCFFEVSIVAITLLLCRLYLWMSNNICSQYFSSTNPMDELWNYIKCGKIGLFFSKAADINFRAIEDIIWGFGGGGVSPLISIVSFQVGAVVFIGIWLCIFNCNRSVWIQYLTIVFGTIEANLLFYQVTQFHRMLLCVMVGGMILVCFLEKQTLYGFINMLAVGVILLKAQSKGMAFEERFALPQKMMSDMEIEKVKDDILEELVYDESNEWNNTVAKMPNSKNLWIYFCIPPYISTQSCTEDYILDAIDSGSLKSKYVLVDEDDVKLLKACEGNGFKNIWSDYGVVIYCKPIKTDL